MSTPTAVLAQVAAGQYQPVYFLQGDEPFFLDEIAGKIEAGALPEEQRSFNQWVVYGKDVDMTTVMARARRYPMMAQRQVVIVREAQQIKDIGTEKGSKELLAYLAQPVPSTVLVFVYKNKVLDGRKALAKALNKAGFLTTSKRLYDNQVPDWLHQRVKGAGYKIDHRAVQLLVEAVGTDLARLEGELKKVFINVQQGTQIDAAAVAQYVGISRDYNTFELQAALRNRDSAKAYRIVAHFEKNAKQYPLVLTITSLYGFYSKLLVCHALGHMGDAAMASALGVHPFFVKDYMQGKKQYTVAQVENALRAIKVAELAAKGFDNADEGAVMKLLVYQCLHGVLADDTKNPGVALN